MDGSPYDMLTRHGRGVRLGHCGRGDAGTHAKQRDAAARFRRSIQRRRFEAARRETSAWFEASEGIHRPEFCKKLGHFHTPDRPGKEIALTIVAAQIPKPLGLPAGFNTLRRDLHA